MAETFDFISRLPAEAQDRLEHLIYFNPQQQKFLQGIVDTIEQYGQPEIITEGDFLRVRVAGLSEVQSLFAVVKDGSRAEPVGVMIYVRSDEETIKLLHIGVEEDYSVTGTHAKKMLVVTMLNQLRAAARRTRGVKRIDILYGLGGIQSIPV